MLVRTYMTSGTILCFSVGSSLLLAQNVTNLVISLPCESEVYASEGACISNPSPAQRAEQENRNRRERERLERERAEIEARRIERDRKVEAQLARFGGNPARRAEAERFVDMQEAAEQARAKLPRRVCTSRTWSKQIASTGESRDSAFASMNLAVSRKSGCGQTGSESLTSMSLGSAANCVQRTLPSIKPPPIGTCLGCITEQQAVSAGYVPGEGWPAPKVEWVCSATAQCAAEKCVQDSKVSRQ